MINYFAFVGALFFFCWLKLPFLSNNLKCSRCNCWQYKSAVTVSPGFDNSRQTIPPGCHWIYDKTFLRDKVGFGVWFEDSHCLERLRLSQMIHFSSPVTILGKNGSVRNAVSSKVQTVGRRSLLGSDSWCETYIPCLCTLPISRTVDQGFLIIPVRLTLNQTPLEILRRHRQF
mgnify:CR=1 FL=1